MDDSAAQAIDANEALPSPAARFRLWLRSFLPFAIILILDPFGCSQVADRYSEQILLRLVAPFHNGGRGPDGYAATAGQAKVSVVLIDQQWLDDIAAEPPGNWPPPRSDQLAQMLHPILEQGPAAVLLDYTFSGERAAAAAAPDAFDLDSPKAIRAQLEAERDEHAVPGKAPTRIFLGSKPLFRATKRGCPIPRIPARQLAAAGDVAASLRNWTPRAGASDVEIVTLRRYDRTHYPLLTYQVSATDGCGEVADGGAYLASPAYALFVTWCEREGRAAGNATCQAAARRPAAGPGPAASYYLYSGDAAVAGSMAPVWPGFRSPGQRRFDKDLVDAGAELLAARIKRCESRGPLPSLSLAASLFWSKLWRADAGELEPVEPCRYGVDVLPMSAFQRLAAEGQQPLKGRYVLVGLDVENVHDVVESPLYGDVPGVLLHAVALENLISWGPRYLSDRPAGLPASGLMLTFVLGFLLSLLAVLPVMERFAARLVRSARVGGQRRRDVVAAPLLAAGAILVMLAIPLLIGLLLSFGGLAPLNWVSLIPAMLWVLELTLEANERALAQGETGDRVSWLRRFWLPVAIVLAACLLLIETLS